MGMVSSKTTWLGDSEAYINWYHSAQRQRVTQHLDELLYALLEPPRWSCWDLGVIYGDKKMVICGVFNGS